MQKALLVNADGYGFTYGNNKGILECLEAGFVKSISVNANFPAFEEVVLVAKRFPQVSIGIHFNLSVGPCVCRPSEIPNLVNGDGCFLGPDLAKRLLLGRIPYTEIIKELSAQVDRFKNLGIQPTHWDGHQNRHLIPPYFVAASRVALRNGITRMRCPRHYLYSTLPRRRLRSAMHLITHPLRASRYAICRVLLGYAKSLGTRTANRLIYPSVLDGSRKYEKSFWQNLIHNLPYGTNEIYCHPGYPDETLFLHAKYVKERQMELEILNDPALAEMAQRAGVTLISFHDIP